MAEWLSADWARAVADIGPDLPEAPGVSGVLRLSFVPAPRKDLSVCFRYADGKVIGAGVAADPDADLVLTLAAEDAADVISGRVEPSVAFMRGRLKASGSGDMLLAFLSSTTDPGWSRWRERVSGLASVP